MREKPSTHESPWWLAKEKLMEFIKKNLCALIVAGAGVLALIFGLILPGMTYVTKTYSTTVGLIGLFFGAPAIVTTTGPITTTGSFSGGLSVFGLLSFLALIAGITLTIVSIFVKDKKLDLIGAILVAVAGVLVFLLMTAGTEVFYEGSSFGTFNEVFEGFSLGAGAIIYGIVALLGGAFGVLNNFKKIVK